jgi:RNA polymerase sigma-70 factor (ECF subfamily)
MHTTDSELLQRAAGRIKDDAAWKLLVDGYFPWIWGMLHAWAPVLQPPDLEDLTQEILLTTFKELPRFERQGKGSFRAWLRTVARHRLLALLASRGRQGTSSGAAGLEAVPDPANDLDQREEAEFAAYRLHRVIELCRHDFDPSTFEAFRLQVFDGVKPSDVAGRLGLSLPSVYAARSRVQKRLKEVEQQLFGE